MTEEQQEVNSNGIECAFRALGCDENSNDPTDRLASGYNMKHKNRGQALILNHKRFANSDLNPRKGTNKDCKSLCESLKNLNFNVQVHKDKQLNEIQNIIKNAARADHTDSDCILIAILSHGETGYIWAKDCLYRLDLIAHRFTAENCKTLAGKPKLFFIQACQGKLCDSGITLTNIESDGVGGLPTSYIPVYPDFLFAYSTIPGYLAWRNEDKGSWFIQSLCGELDGNGNFYNILTLLTFVCQRVALDFESNTEEECLRYKKQIPCITTMLTRILQFTDKN